MGSTQVRPILAGAAIALGLVALASCSSSNSTETTTSTSTTIPTAPWEEAVANETAPLDVRAAWQGAGNAGSCPLLWPTDAALSGLTPTVVESVGGWAYTFDVPGAPGTHVQGYYCATCGGASIGIAGTALPPQNPPTGSTQEVFPDGSFVFSVPEIPVGREVTEASQPVIRGEVYLPDATCRYEVYDFLGQASFDSLVNSLRRVEGAP